MKLGYKARKRWAILVLVVWMPLYIIAALWLLSVISDRWGRPSVLVELALYVGLGFLWALPFKRLFYGTGKPDPAEPEE